MLTMTVVIRALMLATLLAAATGSVVGQAPGVLRVTVTLADAQERATPVPRHALLISDDPPTAAPRRILTAPDGTVEVTLRPGNYVVESDQPVAFNGKAYRWTAMVEVRAGRGVTLELTSANAEAESVTTGAMTRAAPPDNDPSFLLPRWQDSVVALWTPLDRVTGVVVDRRGLVVTTQRHIASATSVEVQLTPAVKVAGRVVAADPVRDVAVLWIDEAVAGSVEPVNLDCARDGAPPVVDRQEIFAIGAPLRKQKSLLSATVSRVAPRLMADFRIGAGEAGGPVFTADGALVGITAGRGERDESRDSDVRVVRVADVCEVLRAAEASLRGAAPPNGTNLPVEQARSMPPEALEDAVRRRAGMSIPYQMSSSDFDIAFITPVLAHAAARRWAQAARAERPGARLPDAAAERVRLLTDFGHWSEYFNEFPPLLLVRVTPKLVERFWARVARGAASTQGVALPPIKRPSAGFRRLAAFCGPAEVTPVHPFMLAHRVSESQAIHEGLYVFDPAALGPHCGTVRLALYSDGDPATPDSRVVEPAVLQRIWEDFGSRSK